MNTAAPLYCSVIIPVWLGGRNFAACVASAAAALRPQDELIVVADGEGDGSWREAEKHGARVLNLPVNRGPAHARNAGAQIASGDILFFLDADVTVPVDSIGKVAAFFEREQDVAALIGSYDQSPGEQNFLSQYKNLFHHYVHQQGPEEASSFWAGCGAIRRRVFLDAGGFDERYRRPSIEDIELGYRLKSASHRIRMIRDLQVTHWKRWDVFSLIKTDLFDRAIPWTELIFGRMARGKREGTWDLNLGAAYRVSIATSFLLMAAVAAGPWWHGALLFVPPAAGLFVFLHLPLFRWFREQRGLAFCAKAVIWRFIYDLYSGIGFCCGAARFFCRSLARFAPPPVHALTRSVTRHD